MDKNEVLFENYVSNLLKIDSSSWILTDLYEKRVLKEDSLVTNLINFLEKNKGKVTKISPTKIPNKLLISVNSTKNPNLVEYYLIKLKE